MRIIRNERGWAMPIALLLLVIIGLIAAVIFDYSVTETKHVVMTQDETRSHYLARSGAESIAKWIIKDPNQVASRIASVNNKTSTNVKLDGVSIPVGITVKGTGSNIVVTAQATIKGETSSVSTRLYQIPELVAVGKAGDIYTYDAYAKQWAKKQTAGGANWTTKNLNSVIAGISDSDNLFVTVGDNGTILISPTGDHWTSISSGGSDDLNDVAFGTLTVSGTQVNKFVAVGDGGKIIVSSDGRTWNSVSSGTGKDLNGVASGNGKFVAVGEDGTILYSTDAATWTAATWSLSATPDQTSWENGIWNPQYYDYNDVAFANNRFVAVADKNYTEQGKGNRHWDSSQWKWVWDSYDYQQTAPYLSYWATSGDGQSWNIISDRIWAINGWTIGWFTINYTYELYPQDLYCVAGNNNNFAIGGAAGLGVQLTGQGIYDSSGKLPTRSEVPNPPPSYYGITYNTAKDQVWVVGNSKYVLHGDNPTQLLSVMDIGTTSTQLNDITATDIYSSSGAWRTETIN